MRIVLKNFRVIDEETDMVARVIIQDGVIVSVLPGIGTLREQMYGSEYEENAALIIDGAGLLSKDIRPPDFILPEEAPVLMPAFVDLHAHFRDPLIYEAGNPFPSETLESAALAAAAGGFGTVVCMANTKPAIDTYEKAAAIKRRSDTLGLVDLYPVLSLTKNLEGKELSEITRLPNIRYNPLMLSEDGKDLTDDALFLSAMKEAKRAGIPISCHCDFGGDEAAAAKSAGQGRGVWSRLEENNAVRRVIELGKKAGCHIHIAHVSTKEAVEMIRQSKAAAKAEIAAENTAGETWKNPADSCGFRLTCEVTPHNLSLTEEDAEKLGSESWGRVNPPLRSDDDRAALIRAVADGTIDAIATDHAPHSRADKEAGVPGFSAFETAFAAAYTELVRGGENPSGQNTANEAAFVTSGEKTPTIDLKRLSSLMSANPARLLGLGSGPKKRGRIAYGHRADIVILDPNASWTVAPSRFKTRGINSPFVGRLLYGEILMTLSSGRIVFQK